MQHPYCTEVVLQGSFLSTPILVTSEDYNSTRLVINKHVVVLQGPYLSTRFRSRDGIAALILQSAVTTELRSAGFREKNPRRESCKDTLKARRFADLSWKLRNQFACLFFWCYEETSKDMSARRTGGVPERGFGYKYIC